MHKSIIAFLLSLTFLSNPAYGAPDGFGLGVIIGEPTGISAKGWLSDKTAIDGAAAWSFGDSDSFQFHADYLFHNDKLIKLKEFEEKLLVYFGAGGRIKLKGDDNSKDQSNSDTLVGIRIPIGVTYIFENNPLDLFIEVVPILDVVPATDLRLNAALGIRYYFF